jgi:PAS domain S-box-containing protein
MSYRILIAEDDADLLRLMRGILDREGYVTEGIDSGTAAIARVAEEAPDLFLLDYHLPDMTAEEVITSLPDEAGTIPFIVITGQGHEEIAVKMMKLGARDYLTKTPLLVDVLPTVVKETISRIETEAGLAAAEEALKAGEERFSLLMQTMSEGLAIQDEDGLISFANETFCQLLGRSMDELAGRRLADLLSLSDHVTFGGAAGKEVAQVEAFEATVRREGSEDARISLKNKELRDSHGQFKGSFTICTDVTEIRRLRERIQLTDGFQGMVGRDVLMTELFDNLREASSCDYPVLIQGESGTGKELVAAAVHDLSARATGRFVPVNCGVLVGELFESDLFGHVKGAFTGAVSDKKGRVAVADGGTFFLDEVSELSPATQAKFLRFLQEGTYERVGDEKTSTVDVRVISATNRDLEKEVAAGRFREDLYFRLSTIPVRVPPLRERRGDIALLVGHIVKQASEKMGREPVPVTPGAMALLTACEWPGNVRELENAVTFALIRSRGDAIDVGHLPAGVGGKGTAPAPLRRPKQKASDEAIRAALEKTGGNMSAAAKLLGISRATLYRRFRTST